MGTGLRYDPLPLGIRCLKALSGSGPASGKIYRGWILILTFLAYMSYHMTRKPISAVKTVLSSNTTDSPGWAPFNQKDGMSLLGDLDTSLLLSYAFSIFISGHIADHVSLRYFLTFGMLGTAIFTSLFGMGCYFKIHSMVYYVIIQVFCGVFQATGWPAVVAVVGNWFGKGNRGLIMGIWTSHTSVGNILGGIIAGSESNDISTWGLSFIFPSCFIAVFGIMVFLYLPTTPQAVGLPGVCQATPDEEQDKLIKSLQHHSGDESSEDGDLLEDPCNIPAVSFKDAIMIPGVIEFSMALFFAKLVCYTFLFWLPNYIGDIEIGGKTLTPHQSNTIATLFDMGGILGAIVCGLLSDTTGCSGIICVVSQIISVPLLWTYYAYGNGGLPVQLGLMFVLGMMSNGPYSLITTAVSADLGTSEKVRGSAQALATVTAIIDGTGSIGAAIGPYLTGQIIKKLPDGTFTGWREVFIMLMGSAAIAALCLVRVVIKELKQLRLRSCDRSPTPEDMTYSKLLGNSRDS